MTAPSFPTPEPLALLLLAAAALLVASVVVVHAVGQRRRLDERIARAAGRTDAGPGHGGRGLADLICHIGERVARSAFVGQAEAARMGPLLAAAGFDHPRALALFVGAKSLTALLGAALAWLWAQGRGPSPDLAITVGACAGAALAGWRLPDLAVANRRRRRLDAIEHGLPDALDLLVICGEAGLGFDVAVGRVGREVAHAHPELGRELGKLAAELRVLPDRAQALANMADRLKLDSVRSFTGMLAQSIRFGTPLGQALRVISAELRTERMVRFEARAAKLPVLITLPMVLFILPCVFIVVGGPALIDVFGMLASAPIGGPLP